MQSVEKIVVLKTTFQHKGITTYHRNGSSLNFLRVPQEVMNLSQIASLLER